MCRKEGVWSRPVGDRAVVYSWEEGRALVLNPTGAALWEALETPRTEAELCDLLVARCPGLPSERARADVSTYLQRLMAENLLRSEA